MLHTSQSDRAHRSQRHRAGAGLGDKPVTLDAAHSEVARKVPEAEALAILRAGRKEAILTARTDQRSFYSSGCWEWMTFVRLELFLKVEKRRETIPFRC